MELSRAIEILVLHNKWRRGAEIHQQHPEVIGQAIDTVVNAYETRTESKTTWVQLTPENVPNGNVFVASVRMGEEPPYVFGYGKIFEMENDKGEGIFNCIDHGNIIHDVDYFLEPGTILAYAKTR